MMDGFDLALAIYVLMMAMLWLARRSRATIRFALWIGGRWTQIEVLNVPPDRLAEYSEAIDTVMIENEHVHRQNKGKS